MALLFHSVTVPASPNSQFVSNKIVLLLLLFLNSLQLMIGTKGKDKHSVGIPP